MLKQVVCALLLGSTMAFAEAVVLDGVTIQVKDVKAANMSTSGVLEQDADVKIGNNSLPLKGGTTIDWWNKSSSFSRGTLRVATQVTLAGAVYELAAGSVVGATQTNGKSEISTVEATGESVMTFADGAPSIKRMAGPVRFLGDGRLWSFTAAAQEVTYDGKRLVLAAGVGVRVAHKNGAMQLVEMFSAPRAKLSIDLFGQLHPLRGIAFAAGKLERVHFDSAEPLTIARRVVYADELRYDLNGVLESVMLVSGSADALKLETGGKRLGRNQKVFVTPDLKVAALNKNELPATTAKATPTSAPAAAPAAAPVSPPTQAPAAAPATTPVPVNNLGSKKRIMLRPR